jgi:hypothetical protein
MLAAFANRRQAVIPMESRYFFGPDRLVIERAQSNNVVLHYLEIGAQVKIFRYNLRRGGHFQPPEKISANPFQCMMGLFFGVAVHFFTVLRLIASTDLEWLTGTGMYPVYHAGNEKTEAQKFYGQKKPEIPEASRQCRRYEYAYTYDTQTNQRQGGLADSSGPLVNQPGQSPGDQRIFVSVHRAPHLLCSRALEVRTGRLHARRRASAAPCKRSSYSVLQPIVHFNRVNGYEFLLLPSALVT